MMFANKATLSESELHVLIEVVKAVVALVVTIFILKRRKREKEKIDKHIEQTDSTHQKN